MSEHTKRISAAAPQLVGDNNPRPSQPHVSILKDLDPTARASPSTRRRALLLPMLALSAVTGGVVASVVSTFFSSGTHPAGNISTASSSTALQMPVVAEPRQTDSTTLNSPPELAAPAVERAAAVILETPQLQVEQTGPAPALQDAERSSSSYPVAVAAVTKTPARNSGASVKPGTIRKSGRSDKQRSSKPVRHTRIARSKPRQDELRQKSAAERDVDIITAIVKDVGR